MRITKVYTRVGDKGTTHLAGGQQVPKDHLRLEAYGTIDELNTVVGITRAFLQDHMATVESIRLVDGELQRIQNKLFDLGAILATLSEDRFRNMPQITEDEIRHLEGLMDRCQKDLKPLKEFVLPGGGKAASFLHLSRTVCRRAERICVRLSREETISPEILKYLNRLSDTFFVWSRWISWVLKEPEFLWKRLPVST